MLLAQVNESEDKTRRPDKPLVLGGDEEGVIIVDTLALVLLKEPPLKPLIDIPAMARLSQGMIRDSLNAFVQHDTALAKKVCENDDEVDRINDHIFRELLTYMMENPRNITRAVDLILVSRNLERVADHATNISEDVIFIEEGKNIKHHAQENA